MENFVDVLKDSQEIMKNFVTKSNDKPVKFFDSKTSKDQAVQKNLYKRGLHNKQGRYERAADKIKINSSYFPPNQKLWSKNYESRWQQERKKKDNALNTTIDFSKLDLR